MMKWLFFFILFSLKLYAQNPFTGVWLTGNKLGKLEVTVKNGVYEARLVWLKNPEFNGKPAYDKNNENLDLRSRRLMGLNIFGDMKIDAEGKLVGPVYDPYRGKIFQCIIWPESKNVMNVRGYWGVLYQTKQWTRVN